MPELPEVETVRRGLEPAMLNARIIRVEQRRANLRFPFPPRFAQRLTGSIVTSLSRRAKYLCAELDSGEVLVMHLGMSGRFLVEDARGRHEPGEFQQDQGRHTAHDHVVMHFENGARITYNDTRRFGFMLLIPRDELAEHKLFRDIGIEPLGNELSGPVLAELFAGKETSLKAALLDQSLIAGLGNIYVSEALHRAGLSPKRKAGSLAGRGETARHRAARLALTIRQVLEEAIEAGGSTLRDFARADGSLGYFQHRFKAYDRAGEACSMEGCGGKITRIAQSGRSTFYCRACQR